MKSLDTLLLRTSRTFALAISLLPRTLRGEVTIAYLLFRIADTLEDGALWPPGDCAAALDEFADVVEQGADPAAVERLARAWVARPPVGHAGYLELLGESAFVLESLQALPAEHADVIRRHLLRTMRGMAGFVRASGPDGLQLGTLDDLRRYCHVVAGVVGEMLAELMPLHAPALQPVAGELRARAPLFGEGLQLVNILKDRWSDAQEGRRYVPADVTLTDLFRLARGDLDAADEYTAFIERAGEAWLVPFHRLLVRLARASLDRIETAGPGAKLSRAEVLAIMAATQAELTQEGGLASA